MTWQERGRSKTRGSRVRGWAEEGQRSWIQNFQCLASCLALGQEAAGKLQKISLWQRAHFISHIHSPEAGLQEPSKLLGSPETHQQEKRSLSPTGVLAWKTWCVGEVLKVPFPQATPKWRTGVLECSPELIGFKSGLRCSETPGLLSLSVPQFPPLEHGDTSHTFSYCCWENWGLSSS